MENFCQLCRETPSQHWELIENWAEVKQIVKVIFKIDLLPDKSVANRLCICLVCNEKLRCVQEFFEMVVAAQDQLKTIVPDQDPGEDTSQNLDHGTWINLRPFVKDPVDNHRKPMLGPKEDLSHKCGECGEQFRRLAALRAHMSSHLSKEEKEMLGNHGSGTRGKQVTSKSKILHLKRVQIKPNPKIYKSNTHKPTPKAVPKAQCKICKRLLANKRSLREHMKTVHTENGPHICDICQKEAPSNLALKRHKQYVHESVRKYSCSYCKKSYKKELELKEHMTEHLGGALYVCQFCETTFNRKNKMYVHRKRMHPKEYQRLQETKYGK